VESVFYFDAKRRKYKGRIRICEKCGREEIVRSNNKGKICLKCIRPHRDIIYYSKEKKYPGRKRKCPDCGKEEVVRLNNKSKYCFLCSERHKKTCVKDNEIFVQRDPKRRQRGKIVKCSSCGIERFIRSDAKYKTDLCKSCAASKNYKEIGKITGKLKRIHGLGIYRNIAYECFKKECLICGSQKNIVVHHKDENRLNNDISNLYVVCNSCHKKIHKYLKSGKTHKHAVGLVKMRIKLNANTNSYGEYKNKPDA